MFSSTSSWFGGPSSPPPTLSEAAKVLSPKRTSSIANCVTSPSANASVSVIKDAINKAQAQMEQNATKRNTNPDSMEVVVVEHNKDATAPLPTSTPVSASCCENTSPSKTSPSKKTTQATTTVVVKEEEEGEAPSEETTATATVTSEKENGKATAAPAKAPLTVEAGAETETAPAETVISPRTLKKQVDEGDEHQTVQEVEASEMLRAVAAAAKAAELLKKEQAKLEALGLDYDTHCTSLYKLIEAKDWKQVLEKLSDDTPATMELMQQEASQYLYRKDPSKKDKMRWRLLPLHASLIFKAPAEVVSKLCDVYPTALYLKDDRGMTPLHLAMRHNATDDVLYELLQTADEQRQKSIEQTEETKDKNDTDATTVDKKEETTTSKEEEESKNDEFTFDDEQVVVGLDGPALGPEPTLPCVLDVLDKRGRKALDLHKAVLGLKAAPMSPKQGEGCETSSSGLSKYVAIMTHDISQEVTKSITADYEKKLEAMSKEKQMTLQHECESYEQQLLALKDELSAKLTTYLQEKSEIESKSSTQIRALSKEVKTAQLGAESLIHRYDSICQKIEEMHLQIIQANARFEELTSGKEGVQSQKAILTEQFVDLSTKVMEAKAQLEKDSEELEQSSNQIEIWNIELKEASTKLTELTASELRLSRENEDLSKEIATLTKQSTTTSKTLKERSAGEQSQLETIVDLELQNKTLKDEIAEGNVELTKTLKDVEPIKTKLSKLGLVEKICNDVTERLKVVEEKFATRSKELDEADVDKWHTQVLELTELIVKLKVEKESLQEDSYKIKRLETKSEIDSRLAKDASEALMSQFKQKIESEAMLSKRVKTMQEQYDDERDSKHQVEHNELLERKEQLQQEERLLKSKRNCLEEDLYHKTYALERLKTIQRNNDNLSQEDQIQKATLVGNEDKTKLLESMVKELQEKLSEKENLHDQLEAEFHQKGYDVHRDQLQKLQDKQLEEESKTKELAYRVQELSEEHMNLKKELEDTNALKEYDLMKLRQVEFQTTNQIQLKQRMAQALEEQLEASQGLSEELQHRLKALEYQHSQMMQAMANGNFEEMYLDHKYQNIEDEFMQRQMQTYQMQQTASSLRGNNNYGMSPDRTMMSSLMMGGSSGASVSGVGGIPRTGSFAGSTSGGSTTIMRTGSGAGSLDGREQPEAISANYFLSSKNSFSSTGGYGGVPRHYGSSGASVSSHYSQTNMIDRAMEQNALLQATAKRHTSASSKTYDDATAAINQLRNLGL